MGFDGWGDGVEVEETGSLAYLGGAEYFAVRGDLAGLFLRA